jgi:1,4-alpha-glucan branching enzyme
MQSSKSPKTLISSKLTTKAVKTTKPEVVKKSPAAKKTDVKRKHVKFQVQVKPESKVYIAGDFNNWDHQEKALSDQDGNGLYQCVVALEPGTYEYKFHINDNWCVDPGNPNFNRNVMGTLNSVIVVE